MAGGNRNRQQSLAETSAKAAVSEAAAMAAGKPFIPAQIGTVVVNQAGSLEMVALRLAHSRLHCRLCTIYSEIPIIKIINHPSFNSGSD
ncbi:hypothetical protein Nepgr_001402 [Nepenthes gracilis]|uniref:Uncharacterized protein n=1 Tax=Nepenthes gracilis TaxID=150966 RepID=A0AAD3P535_NEPGR|nr:hypothetical protein Nepgr_001402 [Nepenthes gracilis]